MTPEETDPRPRAALEGEAAAPAAEEPDATSGSAAPAAEEPDATSGPAAPAAEEPDATSGSATPAAEEPDTTSGSATPPEAAAGASSRAPSAAAGEQASAASATRRLTWLAALLALASFAGPITSSGIWDPFELRTAELSRRIALTLLGASNLAIEGANNAVPTLGELARGQLPFTSIALGFKLFGLHEWAGRLPLVLWGSVGALALYALVARLSDRKAAAFSVIALATMPLYFLQSRTMLGDIVVMAALSLAVSGLGQAIFDFEAKPSRRVLWAIVGAVGLAAGFGARGALVGIAAPALGIGASWLTLRMLARTSRDRLSDYLGAATSLVGLSFVVLGWRAIVRSADNPDEFSMLLGATVSKHRQLPTYDAVIHYLGHGLFPWSAVVPFAVGRLLRPPHGLTGVATERETALRILVLLTAATAFGAHALLAPTVGLLPYAGVAALAAIAGVALADFDRGAPASRVMAMGVAAFAILLYYDFKNFPEKGLSAFVVENARFPDSFKETAHKLLKVGTLGFVALFFGAVAEGTDPSAKRFDRDEYLTWPKNLRSMWSGNLWFGFLVAEAALVGYAVLTWLSRAKFQWKQFQSLSPIAREVAAFGWIALPIAVLVLPALVMFARDVSRTFFLRAPIQRGTVAMLAVAGFGSLLSFGYYPKLAAQISPKEVFDSYRRFAQPGEELAIVGVGTGTATYYAGRDVPTFDNPTSAFNWLTSGSDRRWLVVRSSDLPQINSLHRGLPGSPGNVPVIDGKSSEILLLSNRLAANEQNENPFAKWILDQPPSPTVRMDANLGGQLDVLGWDVATEDGTPVGAVVPRKQYLFRIYYKVVAAISGNWETFIHIDGFQRRFNGDHKTLDNKYPLHLWRVGDYVVDVYPFSLEPNFTPGDYDVFFGLFIGSRRLEVKRGRHNDNRLEGGKIRVR